MENRLMKNHYRAFLLLPLCLTVVQPLRACITCNQKVQEALYDSQFYPNLLAMLLPFILLGGIVAALAWLFGKRYRQLPGVQGPAQVYNPVPLATAALVLGIGLGGFIDGIVLHQILQWHEMLSNKIPPTDLVAKSVNMFWDGIFHAFCLLVVLAGMVLLWKTGRRPDADRRGSLLWGGLLAGWGIFNIVEGLLDHHILKLHNVREITTDVPAWNFGFLGFSVLLLGVGWGLVRKKPGS